MNMGMSDMGLRNGAQVRVVTVRPGMMAGLKGVITAVYGDSAMPGAIHMRVEDGTLILVPWSAIIFIEALEAPTAYVGGAMHSA